MVLQKQHGEDAGAATRTTGDSEILIHRRVALQNRIELLLELSLLIGRRAFLHDEKTANRAAVSGRQQSKRQLLEEEPDAQHARDQDRHGDPAVIEKPMQGATVGIANRVEETLNETLRPGLVMTGPRSFRMREHISGVSVSETKPEARIAMIMVTANSRKIRPSNPA